MLKVADLQQLVNGMTQPMRNAGASQKVLEDLGRLVQGLEPFKERTMGEFNEFLQKADECVRSGQWPAPGRSASRRSSTPREPGMSVDEAAQRIAALMERVASNPNLDQAAIETEVQALQAMTMPQLKEAAEQAHIMARGRTKEDLLKTIAVSIKERRSAPERAPRDGAALNMPTEPRREPHGHQQPVGAGQRDDA